MLHARSTIFAAAAVAAVIGLGLAVSPPAAAIDATYDIWSPNSVNSTFGFDPNMTEIDPAGLTNHVSTAVNPVSIATVYENTFCSGAPCGVTYWNPDTNLFKCYGYSSGAMLGIDINRSAPELTGPFGTTYGPGDTWLAKSGSFVPSGTTSCGGRCSLTVQFPGTDMMRSWEAGNLSSIAVDQATGLIWMTDRSRFISRFDPATNELRRWFLGTGDPRDIDIDDLGRAYATVGCSNQIVRVDAVTNEVTTWGVPAGGLQCGISAFNNNPNGLQVGNDGQIWFAETLSDEIGRLDPASHVICEHTKAGLNEPQNLATSGSGILLQTFVSERLGQAVAILTNHELDLAGAPTQVCTVVTPTVATVTPAVQTMTHFDHSHTPTVATVPPTTTVVDGIDGVPGSGDIVTEGPDGIPGNADDEDIPPIIRFPIPAGSSLPVGITRVAVEHTVFGSLIGTEQMFRLESGPPNGAIIAPPDEPCVDGDSDGICDADDNCPATDNAGQEDGDIDGLGDVCDNCVALANADQIDFDMDGQGDVCDLCPADAENDADMDSVCGDVDFCPGTVADMPSKKLLTGRHANLEVLGDPDFFEVPPKDASGVRFTTEDTQGCSCEQIVASLPLRPDEELELAEEGNIRTGHLKFGCASSIIGDWIAFLADDASFELASAEATLTAELLICDEARASVE